MTTNKQLQKLTDLANQAGAEGVWLLRGAKNVRLTYDAGDLEPPDIPGAQTSANVSINLDIADAGVIALIRFPKGNGGEPGIESK